MPVLNLPKSSSGGSVEEIYIGSGTPPTDAKLWYDTTEDIPFFSRVFNTVKNALTPKTAIIQETTSVKKETPKKVKKTSFLYKVLLMAKKALKTLWLNLK